MLDIDDFLIETIKYNYENYLHLKQNRIKLNDSLKKLSIDYLLFCLPILKSNIIKNTNIELKLSNLVHFYKNNEFLLKNQTDDFFNYYKNNFNIDLFNANQKTLKQIEGERIETAFPLYYINEKYNEIESIFRTYENIKEF